MRLKSQFEPPAVFGDAVREGCEQRLSLLGFEKPEG